MTLPPAGGRAVAGLTGLVGLAAVFELLPRSGAVDSRFLPPTSETARALGELLVSGFFWEALGHTLLGWATGLGLAVTLGVGLGLLIGSSPLLRTATRSTIEFLRPIPSVALVPLAVLLFGTGMGATLLLVVFAAFWQVLVQVLAGTQDVDPVAADTAHSYRLSRWTRVRALTLPTVLPYVATGVRLAAAVALILEVTGGLVIGTPGLGQAVAVAQSSGAVATTYALVVVTGLLGVAVNLGARGVERRVLRWHPAVRSEVSS